MCAWCLIYAFNLSNYVALIYDNAFHCMTMSFTQKRVLLRFFYKAHSACQRENEQFEMCFLYSRHMLA